MEKLFAKVSELSIFICMVALSFVLIPNITIARDNTNVSVTQIVDNASKRNEASVFSFYFKEKGGLVPVNNFVFFDNLSKELVHVNLVNDSISEKILENEETKNLRDAISNASFFYLRPVYKGEGADIKKYLLTVTDDGISKTVSWNDASQVPETLNNVIAEIKKLPH
jgi:hypothetical protein